jgi:RecB family endonuclease NucS
MQSQLKRVVYVSKKTDAADTTVEGLLPSSQKTHCIQKLAKTTGMRML